MDFQDINKICAYEGKKVLLVPALGDRPIAAYQGGLVVPREIFEKPVTIKKVYRDDPKGANILRSIRIAYANSQGNYMEAEIAANQFKGFSVFDGGR